MASKSPITAHPAFQPVVIIWFATLFGIGSLLVPSALAPFGIGVRTAIALAAMVAGAIVGWTIARSIIATRYPPLYVNRPPKPISVREEFGEKAANASITGSPDVLLLSDEAIVEEPEILRHVELTLGAQPDPIAIVRMLERFCHALEPDTVQIAESDPASTNISSMVPRAKSTKTRDTEMVVREALDNLHRMRKAG